MVRHEESSMKQRLMTGTDYATTKGGWVLLFKPNNLVRDETVFANAINHVEGQMLLKSLVR